MLQEASLRIKLGSEKFDSLFAKECFLFWVKLPHHFFAYIIHSVAKMLGMDFIKTKVGGPGCLYLPPNFFASGSELPTSRLPDSPDFPVLLNIYFAHAPTSHRKLVCTPRLRTQDNTLSHIVRIIISYFYSDSSTCFSPIDH